MKLTFTTIFFLLFTLLAQAHPGIGIVKDKKGNIFYSDLKQVWKISPDGKKTIAVPNVHTHELYMDSAGNLFGEHLYYNGEQTNTWGHYVWTLKNNGTVEKIVGPKDGFLTDYSFVRDDAGNMYWVERWKVSRIKKKTPAGVITTIAEGKWGDVRWMYATAQGNVYFTNWYNLYKADAQGNVTILAADLDRNDTTGEAKGEMHNLYGIWTDKQENVYVAVMGEKQVKKITPAGEVNIVMNSTYPWSPSGGVVDNAGNLWVLEGTAMNEVRVRKVSANELATGQAAQKQVYKKMQPVVIAGISSVLFIWAIYRFLQRKKDFKTTDSDKKIRAVETALKPLINNL